MNDEHVIEKLRGAALGGSPATPATAAAVAAGGRKLRRRRHALIGGTSALSVTALVLVLANLGGGSQAVEQVITPADPPGTGMEARQHNLELLRDALGAEDWRITDSKKGPSGVEPKAGSAPTRAVPAGDHIQADLTVGFVGGYGSSPDDSPTCGATTDKGVTCSIVQSKDGKPVRVIHSSISYSPGAAFVATHLTYRRPDGSVSLLDVTVNSPSSSETQVRRDQAMAWLKPLDDTLIAVATNPALQSETRYSADLAQPTPSPSAATIAPEAHDDNLRRLRDALGSEWHIAADGADEDVLALSPNSVAGRGLPAGYAATGHTDAEPASTPGLTCDAHSNPKYWSCEVRRTPDGHQVRITRNKFMSDEPAASARTIVDYIRPDRVQVSTWIDIEQPRGNKPGADWTRAETWLPQFEDALITAATDPRIQAEKLTTNNGLFGNVQRLAPTCRPEAIQVEVVTGHADRILDLSLRNTSAEACRLQGYPTIALFDAEHRVIPFTYSPSPVETARAAVLEPGDLAAVMLSKDVCAAGDVTRAVTLALTLPGSSQAHTVTLPTDHDLSWCGAGDPGSTVTVNPIQGTTMATPAP